MANFRFNVNTTGVIHLTDRLERINKSAFPSAVRATLSDAAFEMKQKNILESAKKNMKVKQPNFFKANTGAERAKFSRNVESMKATSGFINKRGQSANKAVTYGMEANEVGGTDSTGMMYKEPTRTGKGLVRRKNYYKKLKGSGFAKRNPKAKKDSHISFAFDSLDDKKPIMVDTKKGMALILVKKISRTGGKIKITSQLLMLDRTVKKAKAKATHFNREAAQKTQKQMEAFYLKNAEFHFQKVWRK